MTELEMAVLHLPTGHVLGAITAGRQVPTVTQATGGKHLIVRIPGVPEVRVPAEVLARSVTPVDPDVLNRPTHYRISDDAPPLSWSGKPSAWVDLPSKAGHEALSIWDGGTQPEIARRSLDETGKLPADAPPGAVHRLVAVAGEPLKYEL